ncbi:helix-turn-helix transcriptional regulator [Mesorhizobium sp. M0904]|uniref:winged helix-turn-helix transcriptional regulator n=1 Tax=unclassified Mesorhizobium TaxID=325217 RepID=UPI0033370C59
MTQRGRLYGCPVEFALDALGGKWKTVILARIKEQPMRYSDLRRLIPSLSDKMLKISSASRSISPATWI